MQQSDIPEEQKQKLREQAGRIRASGRNPPVHEVLIIKCLAASLNELPLRKNQLTIQAAYQVPEEMRPDVPDSLLSQISKPNTAFLSARVYDDGSVQVAWPFDATEADFNKYIEPWIGNIVVSFYQKGAQEELTNWQRYTKYVLRFLPSNVFDNYKVEPVKKPSSSDTWNRSIENLTDEQKKFQMLVEDVKALKFGEYIPLYANVFFWQSCLSHMTFDEMRSKFEVWSESKISMISATIAATLSPAGRSLLQQALFSSPQRSQA